MDVQDVAANLIAEQQALDEVVAGLGAMFALPEHIEAIDSTPRDAANTMVDVILRGLETTP